MDLLNALTNGLDYAGGIEEKFGGRAIRGALGGKPRELLSVLPFSDSLGITNPSERVTGQDLAGRMGMARDDDPVGNAVTGMGIDLATDPLSYLGVGAGVHAAQAGHAATDASRIGDLRALREPFGMVKDLGGDSERVIGGIPGLQDKHVIDSAKKVSSWIPEAEGASISPWGNMEHEGVMSGTGFSKGSDPIVNRHEIIHGMTKNAAVLGGEDNLPLISKLAAKAYRSGLADNNGLNVKTGIGSALDELGAYTYQGRTLKDKLKGFADFALSPEMHSNYHEVLEEHDPLAAAAYHAAPGAVAGGLGGGAAGAYEGDKYGGAGGAVAGAGIGALLGALGGAGLSHQLYSPLGFNKPGVFANSTGDVNAARKAETYGLARAPKTEAVPEHGVTIEPPDKGYALKPGKPAGRRPSMPPQDLPEVPKYGPDSDLVSAFERMRPKHGFTESLETHTPSESEGSMLSAPEAISQAGHYRHAVESQENNSLIHMLRAYLGQV